MEGLLKEKVSLLVQTKSGFQQLLNIDRFLKPKFLEFFIGENVNSRSMRGNGNFFPVQVALMTAPATEKLSSEQRSRNRGARGISA